MPGRTLGVLFAICVSIILVVPAARAAVVVQELGTLGVPSETDFAGFTDDFGDGEIISFEVAEAANLDAVALSLNILGFIGIDDFSVQLVQNTGTNFDSFADVPTSVGGDLFVSATNLQVGTLYGFLFDGTISGLIGGLYLGQVQLAVVPLPPAVWLFLSALLGLVVVVRHRRHKQPAHLAPTPA